jgi:hypothetical protein
VGHSFVRAPGGAITKFDISGAGNSAGQGTYTSNINASGEIVGTYVDGNNVQHGYYGIPGSLTTLDAPGAGTAPGQGSATQANNAFGVIAGFYIDGGGVLHGFVWTP